MAVVTSPSVMPSGQGVLFLLNDDSSQALVPSLVTAVSDDNEVQSITLAGNPAGGQFTLSFNGQTTAPIPTYPGAPHTYFQINKTGLASGLYDIAINLPTTPGVASSGTPNLLVEVLDDTVKRGETPFNENAATNPGQATNPTPFADGTLTTRNIGTPLLWYPVGRFSITSGTLRLRFSCPARQDDRGWMYIDCARVQAVSDGTTTILSTAAPATHMPADPAAWDQGPQTGQASPEPSGGSMWGRVGDGAGVRYLVDPAVCQSALQALSNVGSGNAVVSGDGSVINPLVVRFVNALGGAPRPLMTCTDGVVSVARLTSGGLLPYIKVNGGSPIKLVRDWLHYNAGYTAMPTVAFYFPQARPTPEYAVAGTYDHNLVGNGGSWNGAFYLGSSQAGYHKYGYTNQTQVSTDQRPYATYAFRPLTAGTYRLSATWPTDAGFSADVTYTITNRAGSVLATVHTSQRVAPAGATDQGVAWQILGSFTLTGFADGLGVVQTNNTADPMVADAVRLELTTQDNSLRITSSDVVTYSAGAGWATCQAGAAPAATDAAVSNKVGGTLYDPLPTTATMGVGWNVTPPNQNENSFLYSNLMGTLYGFFANQEDTDGYPTIIAASHIEVSINLPNRVLGGDGKSYPGYPAGDYDLYWDGASNCDLVSYAFNATEYADQAIFPAPSNTNNFRRFHFPADPFNYGVTLVMRVFGTSPVGDGTYHADIRNIRIYRSGTNPNTVPKFRANFLDRLQGSRTLRWLDATRAIAGNPTTYADFNPPQSRMTRTGPARTLDVPIAEVRQYTGTDYTFDRMRGLPLQFTTPAPHGLAMGQNFYLPNCNGVVHLDDGTDYALNFEPGQVYTLADPTKFVALMYPHNSQTMTNVITNPTGTIHMEAGVGMPLQDMVEVCNAAGANMYFNTSQCATDAALTQVTQYVAQHLNAGLKFYVEFTNETWNFFGPVFRWLANATSIFYGGSSTDQVPATCEGAYHQWGVMRAAWIAAGRSAGDFVRTMATQHTNPGVTDRLAAYCAAHSPRIDFDALSGAPYWRNEPAFNRPHADGENFPGVIDIMTAPQIIDSLEVNYTYGGYEGEPGTHRAVLAAHGYPDVPYMTYEGGPDHCMLQGGSNPYPDWGRRQRAVYRHPRYYGYTLHVLRQYQLGGLDQFIFYQLSGYEHTEGGGPDVNDWCAYIGTDQLPYVPGDNAQDAIQANTPNRADLIQSTTGGAFDHWVDLLAGGGGGGNPPPDPGTAAIIARRLRVGRHWRITG